MVINSTTIKSAGFAKIILLTITALFFVLSDVAFAQLQGSVSGMVTDNETGEAMIGVNVVVTGTASGAVTDLDGTYVVKGLKPGKYTLKYSYVSYSPVLISDIEVKAGQQTQINVALKTNITQLNEIVISADIIKDSENSVLKLQKNADQIMDAVSAEMIKKNNSSDGADILKRMTGVSINDGKYAYIRGVSDRYNSTTLNGASLPSTDPEKKSFSYDIFPSSLIENVMTSKSSTPDKPADFSGGLVQISTVEFPSKFFININAAASYDLNTTFKNFTTYKGGKTDFLGIDDGTRNQPGIIDEKQVIRGNYAANPEMLLQIGRSFKNNWDTQNSSAPVNSSFKLSAGNKYQLGTSVLGLVGALTYSNSFEVKDFERNSWTFEGPRFNYTGTDYARSVLWGALFNSTLKFAQNHKISLKSLLNQSSDDDVIINSGNYEYTSQYRTSYGLRYIERTLFSSQLTGEHNLPSLNNSTINWTASYGRSKRNEPDARRYLYAKDIDNSSDPMMFMLDPSWTSRLFSKLDDELLGGAVNISLNISESKQSPVIKFGSSFDYKTRDFLSRNFGFRNTPGGNFASEDSILHLGVSDIFKPENINGKFIEVLEITKPSDSYNSVQNIWGNYLMADFTLFGRFKVVTGVRYEYSEQEIQPYKSIVNDTSISKEYNDILPSVNLTYLLSDKINLRAAYSKTLARPEFRELAPYTYYDFLSSENVQGNSNLVRSLINNYDLRFEYYPALGEIIAVSLFYKDFRDPIEQVYVIGSGAFEATRSYQNIAKAESYGVEFEFRKSFGFVSDDLKYLSFLTNVSLIKSEVKDENSYLFNEVRKSRPMQGQADYIFNLGLYYDNSEEGIAASVTYNKVGEKISRVGFNQLGDVVELPRDQIDLSLSKKVFSNLSLKISAKDILAQDQVFMQKRPNGDKVEAKFNKGMNLSIGVTYGL